MNKFFVRYVFFPSNPQRGASLIGATFGLSLLIVGVGIAVKQAVKMKVDAKAVLLIDDFLNGSEKFADDSILHALYSGRLRPNSDLSGGTCPEATLRTIMHDATNDGVYNPVPYPSALPDYVQFTPFECGVNNASAKVTLCDSRVVSNNADEVFKTNSSYQTVRQPPGNCNGNNRIVFDYEFKSVAESRVVADVTVTYKNKLGGSDKSYKKTKSFDMCIMPDQQAWNKPPNVVPSCIGTPDYSTGPEVCNSGDGSPGNPIILCNANDVYSITSDPLNLSKHYRLNNDIDMTSVTMPEIGVCFDPSCFSGTPYTGTFDGNGHRLTNVTLAGGAHGLFGGLAGSGIVKNIRVQIVDLPLAPQSGGLVGVVGSNASVEDACVNVVNPAFGPTSGSSYGAIAGLNNGLVKRTFADQVLMFNFPAYSGLLVGSNTIGAVIEDSFSIGYISAADNHIGGIAGYNGGDIRRTYSLASIDSAGFQYIGGIAGWDNLAKVVRSFFGGELTNSTTTDNTDYIGYISGVVDAIVAIDKENASIYTSFMYNMGYGTYHLYYRDAGGFIAEPDQYYSYTTTCQRLPYRIDYNPAPFPKVQDDWDYDTVWKFKTNFPYPVLQWMD